MKKKHIIGFLAFLLGCIGVYIAQYVHTEKVPRTKLTAYADSIQDTAQDIYTDTRYYWDSLTSVDNIQDMLRAISTGTVPLEMLQTYFENMNSFASDSANMTNQALIAYANASTTGQSPSVTIKDSYTIVAKHKMIYPYNNMWETDYLYIYVDNNQDIYSPQMFGSYAVAPNSILLVRDTSFDGVKAYSIPMAQNGIRMITSYNTYIGIEIDPPNDTFIYDSADGTYTTGFRHGPVEIVCKNNDYNTITCNNLVNFYDYFGQGSYNSYIEWEQPLSVLECFLGTGYNYESSEGTMTYMVGKGDWYISTGYFNTQYNVPYVVNNTNNNYNTTVINPALPPVYVVPQDDPWHSGNTIDENTIQNYNDYGLSIDGTNFDLDVDALGVALGAAITPVITGLINGVFSLQPDIGLQFGVAPSDQNYIDLFNDWLTTITVYPPEPAFTRPLVPEVVTVTYHFDLDLPTTETMPVDIAPVVSGLNNVGSSLTDILGMTGILVVLALFGVVVWAIF